MSQETSKNHDKTDVNQQPISNVLNSSKNLSRSSQTNKNQKDGARTLLDAVTAYQRRTARAERTSQRQNLNQNQNPTNSINNANSKSINSLNSKIDHQKFIKSTNSNSKNQHGSNDISFSSSNTHNDDYVNKNFQRSNVNSNSLMINPSSSNHHQNKFFTNKNSNLSIPTKSDSKLFDLNSNSLNSSNRSANEKAKSKILIRNHKKPIKPNSIQNDQSPNGLIDDYGSSHSNPSYTSVSPIKHSTSNLRSNDHHQDRNWKSKKLPLRGNLNEPRQLFDPRKHDPVKFANAQRTNETNSKGSMISIPNNDSHSPIKFHSIQNGFKDDPNHRIEEEDERNHLIVSLKQAYKRIVNLEAALRDEENIAKSKNEEMKTREIRDSQHYSRQSVSQPTALLKIHTPQNRNEEDYWVKLAKQHQELAEAHHLFLQMALDPRLPASMHALPQKYNTPSRLWQTAFHQLLERLRHALPQSSNSTKADQTSQLLLEQMTDFIYFAYGFYTALLEEQRLLPFKSVWIEQLGDLARYRMAVAGLMSKLAGQNHNNKPSLVSSQTKINQDHTHVAGQRTNKQKIRSRFRRRPREDQGNSSILESQASLHTHSISPSQLSSQSVSLQRSPSPPPPPLRNVGGSIGLAALGDWDFEEQEIWRATAKDWYSKGLAENPGTGRLHHHLALLSKGDELRALYHYCKSLTASHPYLPARESILPFFEQEHQFRRSRPEVSINDLFVHLHGMLFTRIQLDDFENELARFIEKLTEDRLLSERQGRALRELDRCASLISTQPTMSDASWAMMGAINICALLQYGAEDGVIRAAQQLRQNPSQAMHSRHAYGKGSLQGSFSTSKSAMIAPQAILLSHPTNINPSTPKAGDTGPRRLSASIGSEDGLLSFDNNIESSLPLDHPPLIVNGENIVEDDQAQTLMIRRIEADENDEESGPPVFMLAARFTFEIFKDVLQQDCDILCPYLTIILTFLASISSNSRVMRKLERFVPWGPLALFLNRIPKPISAQLSNLSGQETMGSQSGVSSKFRLQDSPLLEDWCLRGMECTCKSLFGRGLWKSHKSAHVPTSSVSNSMAEHSQPFLNILPSDWNIDSEMDALTALSGGLELGRRSVENFPIHDKSEIVQGPYGSEARWKRVGLVASWFIRSAPCFEYEPHSEYGQKCFVISTPLKQKIKRWDIEAKREQEEQRKLNLQKTARERRIAEFDEELDRRQSEDDDDEDDDDDNACDNELVKSLKARRRELKALLNQTKKAPHHDLSRRTPRQVSMSQTDSPLKTADAVNQRKGSKNLSKLNAFPGYTALVFDTNILIGKLSIVKELLESKLFTIIIPLVVITELDGLKKKANDQENQSRCLGQDALQAIRYLESSIKTYSRWLKIQTSKGNYLRDLSIRSEEINFQDQGARVNEVGISTNEARNLDDVVLRATIWQLEHFSNRLPTAIADQKSFEEDEKPEKVILVTLDRNLRLKARARGMVAADEKQIISLVDSTKPKAGSTMKG
ncbi:hypothetical protein O181_035872 [Austropuccinia psidii MF-1]|uniref:PIN domain-containing protein n=1 Tax=Austropuccinia psidii MF-1 TaxID=1389203 RepID=A0A9Q3D9I2_9BASI|nr:hypothetical protein [Austropuccinia psidii MF-1]